MKLKYKLNDDKNGLVVTSGKDLEGELTIPSEDCFEGKNYPVIAIGNNAFEHCSGLTSIRIPDSVTEIGDLAFLCCEGLTSVVIPDSVTKIGDWAFWCCEGLTSVVISDSVTKIGQDAFHGCSALTSIIVDKENRHYDSREGCNAIIETDTNTLVKGCSTTVIHDSVTKIGNGAFWRHNRLTSIRIPDSVTKIGDWAFNGCSALTSIVIPNSVTKIGQGAFLGCSGLTSIIVDKENEHYDSREECNAIIESDTNTLVAGCSNTVIPDSVTKIGNYAFCGCEKLISIQIPDSVTEIGERAFRNCKGLISIIIPNSVTNIGDWAFCGCEKLTSIQIPDSVTKIGDWAFSQCKGLTSIVISDVSLLAGTRVPEGVKIVKPFSATRRMLYNPATIDMPDNNGEIILSKFLSDNGIPVPDNQTPDSEMGAAIKHVIKRWIVDIREENPEKVVNEASLSADLHMTFFNFMTLLRKLRKKFHLNSAILEAKTKRTRKLVVKDVENSKNFPLVLPTVGELTAFYEWMSKPDRGYLAFNMKEALQAVRESVEKTVDENEWLPYGFVQYVNNIPDDITVEELPIYRDYLSKFTPGPLFRDKLLLTTADDRISKDDGDLFFKMVCGSISSTYDLEFNEEWDRWELTIHVEDDEGTISKKAFKMHWTSIRKMYAKLLIKYLMLEYILKNHSGYEEDKIQKKIEVFEQKMQALEAKYKSKPLHAKDFDIDAELDKLLNSTKKTILTEESISTAAKTHAVLSELRSLLFVNLDIPMDKVTRHLQNMEAKTDLLPEYQKMLTKKLDETIKDYEGKPANVIATIVLDRIGCWKRDIGPVSIAELAAMSKRWNIAIDKLYSEKITPEIIKQMLDIFLLGQEEYKTKLSTAFYTYLMKKNYYGVLPKSNLLVVGPSGSGKTYGMQVLSSLFHVPFAIIHCNNLVQEGIEGSSLTDPFTALLQKWSQEELEHTIVCFDEFDKLFEKKKDGSDSGTFNSRIVNEMLNIIDDKGEVVIRGSENKSNHRRISIPNQKMMFVFTGVFEGLNYQKETVEERRPIGFIRNSTPGVKKAEKMITAEDFIRYGIKKELMGRIQNFVIIDSLSEDDLVRLFDMGANSPFAEFEQYFAYNNISTILTEEGKRTLAKIACQHNLGVRGLKSILQKVLSEDMYDLEVGEDNILRITKEYISDNLHK